MGCECPARLFYSQNPKIYSQSTSKDAFNDYLAGAGHQVGELAKAELSEGFEIHGEDIPDVVKQTHNHVQQGSRVLFEAAFVFENLLARTDILVRDGAGFELVEVKAKSFNSANHKSFFEQSSEGSQIRKDWLPYLADIAFQTYVMRNANPNLKVTPYLQLIDSQSFVTVDRLNSFFPVRLDSSGCIVASPSGRLLKKDLGASIFCKVQVTKEVDAIISGEVTLYQDNVIGIVTFEQMISLLSTSLTQGFKIETTVGKKCKKCLFEATADQKKCGMRSGVEECWASASSRTTFDVKDSIVNIWNFSDLDDLLSEGIYTLDQVKMERFETIDPSEQESCFSKSQRQRIQIEAYINKDKKIHSKSKALGNIFSKLEFPFYFIDFETCAPAIPFFKGISPYSQIAFQYSLHKMDEEGKISHFDQFICAEMGVFPNFKFLRRLKNCLEKQLGTLFIYSKHEITVLKAISAQLINSNEIDRAELVEWIEELIAGQTETTKISSKMNIVDLLQLLKGYYYVPEMEGSNSIKSVLPAILNHSPYLCQKYSKPVYGGKNGIKSSNYENWTWIPSNDITKVGPYELLADSDPNAITVGTEAMSAYAKLQESTLSLSQREKIVTSLLRYCELDTLGMVMIVEHWLNDLNL